MVDGQKWTGFSFVTRHITAETDIQLYEDCIAFDPGVVVRISVVQLATSLFLFCGFLIAELVAWEGRRGVMVLVE